MVLYDGFMVRDLCFYLSWKERKNIERKKRIWKGILNIVEMIREKNSGYFVCGIVGNRELEVIL